MTTQPSSPIEARIGALRDIQTLIAGVRAKLDALPTRYHEDVAAELRSLADELSAVEHVAPPVVRRPKGGVSTNVCTGRKPKKGAANIGTVRERVKVFFRQRGNEPATMAQIVEGIGSVGKTGVGTLLYRRND